MNVESFSLELEAIVKFDDTVIRAKLKEIIDAPLTYEGYRLLYEGTFMLIDRAGLSNKDERVRNEVYERSIKMLEQGEEQPYYIYDYVASTLSHFDNPPIPEEYMSRLKKAATRFLNRIKSSAPPISGRVQRWIESDFAKVT